MVEIRAGTGGDEASIFAGDLFKMYTLVIVRAEDGHFSSRFKMKVQQVGIKKLFLK